MNDDVSHSALRNFSPLKKAVATMLHRNVSYLTHDRPILYTSLMHRPDMTRFIKTIRCYCELVNEQTNMHDLLQSWTKIRDFWIFGKNMQCGFVNKQYDFYQIVAVEKWDFDNVRPIATAINKRISYCTISDDVLF